MEALASARKLQRYSHLLTGQRVGELDPVIPKSKSKRRSKSHTSNAVNLSESIIEHKIKKNLNEQFLICEEKHKQLSEIKNLKDQISLLHSQLELQKESIKKELKKGFKKSIKAKNDEIAKLKSTIEEIQGSNGYLAQESNGIKQDIHELNERVADLEYALNNAAIDYKTKSGDLKSVEKQQNASQSISSSVNTDSTTTPENVKILPSNPQTPTSLDRNESPCTHQ